MSKVVPYTDFSGASSAILKLLHERVGFKLWMTTRREGDDWMLLQVEDHGYNIPAGTVLRWSDSYCSRMVRGEGPQMAPIAGNIDAYVQAPINRQAPIGAYIGIPLVRSDGSLFGTLCAIDPEPQPESITAELPYIKIMARLLVTILCAELETLDEFRAQERLETLFMTDPATGLLNSDGWEQNLGKEQVRVQRYGSPTVVFCVRLGDQDSEALTGERLTLLSQSLRAILRRTDTLASSGQNEFWVLAVEADEETARQLYQRIMQTLSEAKISASVGFAKHGSRASLQDTWRLARQNAGVPLEASSQ